MKKEDVKGALDKYPILKNKLFARGFLFTDDKIDGNSYPFYGLWSKTEVEKYQLLVAPKQHYYVYIEEKCSLILIGHAYNPFSMEKDENAILSSLQKAILSDETKFFDMINELTGVFTIIWLKEGKVFAVGDATGMQTTFYTYYNEHIFISSHTNLLGDILSLSKDPYVEELSQYRFFRLLGNSLPGDLSPFLQVKLLIPNHYIFFEETGMVFVKRFYMPEVLEKTREEIVAESSSILCNNLKLISEKWEKPAISMTGGCDSKTTLACANGLYDRFSYFSYTSSEAEMADSMAARKICEELGLSHTIYEIPSYDISGLLEAARIILRWNGGDLCPNNENDVLKRLFFADTDDFDVEVKSWASEVGRAYYSKRFSGRTDFGEKPTPRACTTLYKFFLHNRKLVKKTDDIFAQYLEKYFQQSDKNPLPWQEQFFWEFRVPSWNGLVITGEHRYSFDITIPYNNRKLLMLLLSATIYQRIGDEIYAEIRQQRNAEIDKTGIAVTNLKHTENRGRAENIYFILHSKFPL